MGQAGSQPGGAQEHLIEATGLGPGAAADRVVQVAMAHGYTVVASGPNRFRMARTYRPKWALFAAVGTAVFVGLGLLFLLVKRTETGDVVVAEDRSGVKVRLTGQLQQPVIDALRSALGSAAATSTPNSNQATAQSAPAPAAVVPAVVPVVVPAISSYQPAPPPVVQPTVVQPTYVQPTVAQAVLVLGGGQVIFVGAGGVLGRDPSLDSGASGGQLYPIADPSLSKTHLSFGPLPTGVWVQDHHSTNGTVVTANGVAAACAPGARVEAPFGAQILAGDVSLLVGSR